MTDDADSPAVSPPPSSVDPKAAASAAESPPDPDEPRSDGTEAADGYREPMASGGGELDLEITEPRARLRAALDDPEVAEVAAIMDDTGDRSLVSLVRLGLALAKACGDGPAARRLDSELSGYGEAPTEVPEVRRATGFASAFPVRALDLGLLDPEEIFSANNEKFSQVTLTIGQPVGELEQALSQIRSGGVLALKVPASEVSHRSADTSSDTEIYIYILPREIQKIVDGARAVAIEAMLSRIVAAAASNE